MRIIVCGGRDFDDFAFLDRVLTRLHMGNDAIEVIVTGGCTGADKLAAEWGSACDVAVVVYEADWKKHGRAAGPLRNAVMAQAGADLVVAFPGGRGTADMISKAVAAGIPVQQMHVPNNYAQSKGDEK